MTSHSPYYQHSGSVGPLGPLAIILAGLVGAVVGGALYGFALFYIPFVYLNVLLTLTLGALVGYLVGRGAVAGKVRNPALTGWSGAVFGLVAVYAGWVAWLFAFSGHTVLVLSPASLGSIIGSIAEQGAWSLFGWTPAGMALYAIWFVELVLIVGVAALTARDHVQARPFCEWCSTWMAPFEEAQKLAPITDSEDLAHRLERADYTPLASLRRASTGAAAFSKFSVLTCPRCEEERYLTIKSVRVKQDAKGRPSESEDVVLEHLRLTPEVHNRLRRRWLAAPVEA